MRLIVAEPKPIVYSAIEPVFKGRNLQVSSVSVRDRSKLLSELGFSGKLVVLSNRLLPGYTTNELFAREVKSINPNVIFVVYDGVIQNYSRAVDLRIPVFISNGKNTFGGHIVDFLSEFVFGAGSGIYVQLSLF